MYTIKQASLRTGVGIPLLRAWERRYGIPKPARTVSRYRLYDDAAIASIRHMQSLIASGWSPSEAARAILEGRAPEFGGERGPAVGVNEAGRARSSASAPDAAGAEALAAPSSASVGMGGDGGGEPQDSIPIEVGGESLAGYPLERLLGGAAAGRTFQGRPSAGRELLRRFVGAAQALDEPGLEAVLDEAFAGFGVDMALSSVVLPALSAVGEGWANGLLDVASEHAATSAVMRRLGALYEASAQPAAEPRVVVGLPPGGRHEIGALAFALACRRAGLGTLYLGADVPLDSWRLVAREHPQAAIVLGAVSAEEGNGAAAVAAALREHDPRMPLAIGGANAPSPGLDGVTVLGPDLRGGVEAIRAMLRD